jgi:iron complex transport system substrate-binding protein
MNRFRHALALIMGVALAVLAGCSTPSGQHATGAAWAWAPVRTEPLEYAQNFSIEYDGQDRALVTSSLGQQLLVLPSDVEEPPGVPADITVLRAPLTNIYLAATATGAMFASMDALSDVGFSSLEPQGWYIPQLRSAMESGQIRYGGKYSAPDFELLTSDKPSLALENTMINHAPQIKEKLEALGIPVFIEMSSNESHPLARMEWIKLFGLLTGRRAAAEQVFVDQKIQLGSPATNVTERPTVAYFYLSSNGYAMVRQSGDYIPKMIEIAGGKYIFDNVGDPEKSSSTTRMEMEQFYAQAKDADYVIYNDNIGGSPTRLDQFEALNPLLADFRAVRLGHVFSADKDFYQNSMSLGSMVADMRAMLEGHSDGFQFLRKLS